MRFFEDIAIGLRRELGTYAFTAEAIKTFAAKFDPQRFHLDEEEGRKSLFGGLAASGWHVGSACMGLIVADNQRQAKEASARGETVAVWGPSPGFRDLRWMKPVLAGDTVATPCATAVIISVAIGFFCFPATSLAMVSIPITT